jgi:hypothetical protein
MRHFGLNSTMQTLEIMRLNDQFSDMREGRPPRRGPPNDVGPGCLLKFMALAALITLMVCRLDHGRSGGRTLDQPSPEPSRVEANTPSPVNPDRKAEPMRHWTDVSGKYQVEASLVDCTDDMVCLQKTNGRNVRVAMDRLCPEDREYVYHYCKRVSFQ